MEAFSLVRAERSGDFATGARTMAAPRRIGDFATGFPGRVRADLTTGGFGTGADWVPVREPWTRWSIEVTVRREPARGLTREAR
jgi:hypothetical protein